MIDVPEDLSRSWMMMVRPEGDRCLLFSDGGRVQVRRKNGYVHERYLDVRLPKGLTILDVVCVEGPSEPEQTEKMDQGVPDEVELEGGDDDDQEVEASMDAVESETL